MKASCNEYVNAVWGSIKPHQPVISQSKTFFLLTMGFMMLFHSIKYGIDEKFPNIII